jgi:hypothetical protein
VLAAHAMFDLPLWQVRPQYEPGAAMAGGFVATFRLLPTILGCIARAPSAVPYAVGLYITAAYWFTASTSFAKSGRDDCVGAVGPSPESLLQASSLSSSLNSSVCLLPPRLPRGYSPAANLILNAKLYIVAHFLHD